MKHLLIFLTYAILLLGSVFPPTHAVRHLELLRQRTNRLQEQQRNNKLSPPISLSELEQSRTYTITTKSETTVPRKQILRALGMNDAKAGSEETESPLSTDSPVPVQQQQLEQEQEQEAPVKEAAQPEAEQEDLMSALRQSSDSAKQKSRPESEVKPPSSSEQEPAVAAAAEPPAPSASSTAHSSAST